ncbi:MAG: SIMPL domain-containing protein [Candidatus Sungbacteria bacterium]|nr:SIMPL domain-containing protein [Candidatus Sungbacteria bacterium]
METNTAKPIIKNLIGASIVIILLVLSYAALVYVGTYSRSIQPGAYRSFSVAGEGKVVAVPDVASFTFSLITQGGKDLGKLQQENTERVNRASEFIKSEGIDAKDVKAENYSVEPRYQYFNCNPVILREGGSDGARPCPPPEIVGYTITKMVSVKVREKDFSKIGGLLSGVVSAGANSVSQLSFTVDDPTKLENEARGKAIVEAQEKAGMIAKAGGFGVGRLISIQEGGGYYPRPMLYGALESKVALGGADAAPSPTVEPGSQDIRVNVTLVYEIE